MCYILQGWAFCPELLSSNTGGEKSEITVTLHIIKFFVKLPEYETRVLCGSHNYFCDRSETFIKYFYSISLD